MVLPMVQVALLARSIIRSLVCLLVMCIFRAPPTNCICILMTGSSIRVYGTIPGYHDSTPVGEGAVSEYYLDNSTTPSQIFVATPRQETVFQQIFFQSPNMSDSTHSLTITIADDTVVDGTAGYWVDFFIVTPAIPVSSVSQTGSLSSFSLTTSYPTSTVTLLPTVTPVETSSKTSGSIIGADIGPIIAGGLLLLGTLAIWGPRLWRRIQNRRRRLQLNPPDHGMIPLPKCAFACIVDIQTHPTVPPGQISQFPPSHPISTPNIDEIPIPSSRAVNQFTESDRGLVLELGTRADSSPPPPPVPTSSRPVNPFTSTSDDIEEVPRHT